MKSKKRQRRQATAEAASHGEEHPGAGSGGEARQQKRKRKLEEEAVPESVDLEPPSEPPVTEDARRNAQREIQKLVLSLRSAGKSEREIKLAKKELKSKLGPLKQPESKQTKKSQAWQEWLQSDEGVKHRKGHLANEHQLVVIPVVWRGRHDREDVMRAAEDVKSCIAQQGVDVWLDSRRHYSPGQKFAHWEHRGVMLRVEVGPEDLAAGVCRVCRAKTPGDYRSVERRRVRLPPAGARKLLLLLKAWGLSQIAVEPQPGDNEGESSAEEEAPAELRAVAAAAPPAGADDVEGNWAPHAAPKTTTKRAAKGGGRGMKRRAA